MDEKRSSLARNPENVRSLSVATLGEIDAARTAAIVAAAGDVALIVDRDGFIRDMAISNLDIEKDGAGAWLGQRWSDTVTAESQHKVEAMLREAQNGESSEWRELSQFTATVDSFIVRYICVRLDLAGNIIAIGRDDRVALYMHQRLIEAQQAIERDYSQLRDAKTRFLMLFQASGEAVLVVDLATKKVSEANPSAEHLLAEFGPRMVGEPFIKLFDEGSQHEAASLLSAVQSASRTKCPPARLVSGGQELMVFASSFRQGQAAQCMVRLAPTAANAPGPRKVEPSSAAVLERLPDAFVITDAALRILYVNAAFLDMTAIATKQQALGEQLSQFLGRAGVERNFLVETLREHGLVRSFGTILRNRFADQEDVEISAVSVADDAQEVFGFLIRGVRRRPADPFLVEPEARRSMGQLTELIGRMKLKDLVRESTDIVERLCIESALGLTKGNRAAAADLLGVSRQSLYSKLHRFGLVTLSDTDQ